MKRRDFLKLSAAAVARIRPRNQSASAQAAAWPTRPVKLIIPYAPGGAAIIGRPWADALSQAFGRSPSRKPRRRGRHDRRRGRLEVCAGRLHLPAHAVRGDVDPAAAAPDAI
ncbi:MAG: hypothetical protein R3D69_16935 [Xanthobacteraceae bacterium]